MENNFEIPNDISLVELAVFSQNSINAQGTEDLWDLELLFLRFLPTGIVLYEDNQSGRVFFQLEDLNLNTSFATEKGSTVS
jgi:hypothetical protein